ncbi:3-ketoacyl-ACP reductase [Pandoraea communis]|uniref:3-ketoacyl-ACP reductase n=1 Tax=Pandoraea communis TaxID=2508297 RepID=A0A5E4U440_9BURK|nr:SDR family NAD(P)-dependent oxidoreductase [Pandoraea communis]VVD94880.1 3-ketoacyl-ACP reductase [Pandoraea communis]
MNLNLKNKVAIITGPAKGMGRAVTLAFAAQGTKLILTGRDTAAIERVADEVRRMDGEVIVVRCDLTNGADTDALAAKALSTFGRIDVLVNVAGGSGPIGKRGWETTEAEFDDILRVNVTGAFNAIRAVMPAMIEQRYGKVVNVGGTFGMRGRAGRMAYSASKWGLRGVTKSFALEAGVHNINVNCVAPGMVDGPRFREKVCAEMACSLGISLEQAMEKHAQDYALKRVSTDEDVANACLFLASDVSRQITGIDLPVDGGWAML